MKSSKYQSLIELLKYRQSASGGATAFTFQGQSCTYRELGREIDRFAARLLEAGLERDEPVIILLPNGKDFFVAFYGVQRAGGIAVPLFPMSTWERVAELARGCGATRVVAPASQPWESSAWAQACLQLLDVSSGRSSITKPANFPIIHPDDIAFLQYTSGSTGDPKAVVLSHENLLTNVCQMIAGMEITENDVFISWLPVYHDMGLILMTMAPFYLAAELHLLPTNLQAAHAWFDAIQKHRGTFTAAPDFAYRLGIRSTSPGMEPDLSSLRVALNAAEPVRAQTISDFERTFGLNQVMSAGYGLAEATVGVSMMPPGSAARVNANGLVSVGRPFPGIDLKILGDGRPVPAGKIGEIAIDSIANSRGYYEDPAATEALFWGKHYLLTGDLGYLDEDGYLTVVGRKKNIIKHSGETIAPAEIEELVDAVPGVRFSAALGIDRGRIEGEQVYIFAELRGDFTLERAEAIIQKIVNDFHARLGFRPGRVYLLKPHALPRTHNGKIQHALLKERFTTGELRSGGSILFPEY